MEDGGGDSLPVPTEKSIREQFEPLFIQKSSAALCSNTYLLDPIPDESRTRNIQLGRPTGERPKSLEPQDVIDSESDGRPKYVPSCRHNLSSSGHGLTRSGRGSHMTRSQEPRANRKKKQPQSCSDRGCQEAGDESRTHNIQLGRLTL